MTRTRTPAGAGKLYLVSLGVGDPDNLTLRADRVMRAADLVLGPADAPSRYAAQLNGKRFIEAGHGFYTPMARRHSPREMVEAEEALRRKAIRECIGHGGTVAVLSLGDPTLYGPQIGYLREFRDLHPVVVPGISSFAAANAALGMAVTGGRTSQSVILSLGKNAGEGYAGSDRLPVLAQSRSALVLFTMKTDLARVVHELRAGYPGDTPAAIVCHAGSDGRQRVMRATLDTLVEVAGRQPLPFEHLVYIGDFLDDPAGDYQDAQAG
ncbi:MAG: SAM-dependent methyltransferase [Pigmentiphaga sp.]|uniref:SAM-dependent methyltransferase n=1 Tax=Pigmentiphaga sp. TaxID=1977564 RepID=UPI0029A8B2A5|nr:SAM-dependent methyltransferase [Pigmentiphaga sp.]MDX3907024.1 SAM-dependent methyltransferase [Pigmentiphaga sp.]